jgi:GNAT superfamily N-acetyltransferase
VPSGRKPKIVDAGPEAIADYGMCGYRDPESPGFRRKLEWLGQRFEEGLRIKVLRSEADGVVGWIEYLPGEFAWRGVRAPGYMVIHCLFIMKKAYKGKGYGRQLIEACEEDARAKKMHGVAVVASKGTWMAKKAIFLRNGYELIEEAPPHFQLLAKRFTSDAPLPGFTGNRAEKLARHTRGLTIIYCHQCPYVSKALDEIPPVAREEFGVKPRVVALPDCRSAQDSPNPYGVFSIIWNGELVADHPISKTRFRNIMKRVSR